MKRRIWIVAMSVVVLGLGFSRPARADAPTTRCKAYACLDNSGCDLGCTCQFPAFSGYGTCG